MLRAIDNYYLQLEEPTKSCFLFLREHLLALDSGFTEEWKYRMPFFYYKGKMFCYLWFHKKFKQPYLAFIDGNRLDHPLLLQEDRAKIKILLLNPEVDLPLDLIDELLAAALALHK